jgi:hypothetical protein
MTLEGLDRSIYWQRYVIKNSTDPAQVDRCRRALAALESQRAQLLTKDPTPCPGPNLK